MKALSTAQYAATRGVTVRAIERGVAEGRIPAKKVGGKTRIDKVTADRAWPEMQRGRGGGRPKKKSAKEKPETTTAEQDSLPDQRAQARTDKDLYQARKLKLEYEQAAGFLVDAAAVEQSAFAIARSARDALLAIPDRVSQMLAGQTDAAAIHKTLTDEIMLVCGDLQKAIDRR